MKVGIVIVAHNASLAVRTTLASVRRARTRVPYELMLVDNASAPAERECIAHAFAVHRAIMGDGWCYLPQDGNLGFSGGNNVAVRHFLKRTDISHLCLLNSDVIVPHHWLDRLVEKGLPILSGVTNKAESDQCVPIDYEIQLHDCLLPDSETLAPEIAERVDAFAAARYRAFRGCTVEADVTFFCVLIERQAMAAIGLLDEAFFPGGYEDNDYCLRAEAAGVPVHLARDTFIHHWGSASFAQLQHEYFSQRALHNIRYLEAKHGKPLEIHPEKPLISFGDDFAWALRTPTDPQYLSHLNALYRGSLTPLIGHFRSEFEALTAAAVAAAVELPTDLAERVQRLPHADDPVAGFAALSRDVDVMISHPPGHHELLRFRRRVVDTAATVREMVRANLEIHRALQVQAPPAAASATTASAASPTLLQKLHWALRKGGHFLWTFRGIVFFGGYPYPERESDGYFQRIQIVDGLFGDLWRVYVESTELPGRGRWIDRPAERVLVLRVMGGRWRRLMVRALATIAALRCGRVYYHSVLRTYDQRFGRLLRLPWLRKAIDIHGVVPEEFRFHNDFYSASLYDREERLAVRHSDLAIVVSEAMSAYLRQKYRAELKARVTTFPMFPPVTPDAGPRPYPGGRPTVVYAGGLHRWQQVPKMIAAIERTYEHCDHRFYTAKPEEVRAMLAPELRDRVVVESREHAELMGLYRHCHFGFLLREDVVVNHVACPTKAVEYFAKGVVPIVDSENIGDFVALGMRSVPLADFLAGRLPAAAERDEMAQQNLAVYERLKAQRDAGAHTIVARLGYPERRRISAAPLAARLKLRAARLLPRGTRRGHLARRLAARLSSAPGARGQSAKRTVDFGALPDRCDILMQVDNFEAGGLENVVLDLVQVLSRADYKVVLVVLGQAGTGVARARDQGTPVAVLEKCDETYRALLARLRPQLALTHYSPFGARACAEAGIPFLQVIHNIYLWLSGAELAEFRASARHTTGFIAVSESARRYSIARLGLDPAHCISIPNGIDTDRYRPSAAGVSRATKRAELGIGVDDYVFLAVGSINHQKNHLAALQAFAAAAGAMPHAKLVILGPVYERLLFAELNDCITAHGLAGRAIYAGAASCVQPYYAMADALVISAFFEGGPLTLLEALTANLAVIATEVGFAPHFAGMPGIELIAPAFDILEYRGGITDMAFDRDFVQSLSAAMTRTYRRRARPDLPPATLECFDKANTYACYLDLIGRILTGEAWEALRRPESWPERLREQRFDALARLPEPDVHLPQARHVTGSGKLLSETG